MDEGATPVVGLDESFRCHLLEHVLILQESPCRVTVTMPSSSSVKSNSSAARPAPAEQPHPNRRPTMQHRTGFKPITEKDGRIEDDIHAMDAEADHLRWSSRVDLPDSSSITSTSVTFNLGQRARSKSRSRIIKDSVEAMPFDESSHIEHKRLREGAMNAIVATNRDDVQAETSHSGRKRKCEPNMVNDYHRIRSSISGREKRISTSFEVDVIRASHSYMCSRALHTLTFHHSATTSFSIIRQLL